MASPAQFAQNMRRHGNDVDRNRTKIQRKVAAAILSAVVTSTPVGNPTLWHHKKLPGYVGGRARANWLVGNGGPRVGAVETRDPNGGNTIAVGTDVMSRSSAGQPIHLTNNLPYIVPLDEGHSHQAPAGFVKRAVLVGIQAVHGTSILSGS